MQDLVILDNILANIQDPELGSEQDTATYGSGGFARLKTLNGRFVLVDGGEEVVLGDTISMVVAQTANTIGQRAFQNAFKKSSNESPVCWSTDGVKADSDVPKPIAKTCAACPWNARGSSSDGEGRKCGRRLPSVVVLESHPDTPVVYPINAVTLWGDVQPGQPMPWVPFKVAIAKHDKSYSAVILEASIDASADVQNTVRFMPLRARTKGEEIYDTVQAIRADYNADMLRIAPPPKAAVTTAPDEAEKDVVEAPPRKATKADQPRKPAPKKPAPEKAAAPVVEEAEYEEEAEVKSAPVRRPRTSAPKAKPAAPVAAAEVIDDDAELDDDAPMGTSMDDLFAGIPTD